MNTEEFIKKAKEVHGDKYDYSKVKYINSKTKVYIICPKHGVFSILPSNFLKGQNCRKCSLELKKVTKEQFIQRAKEIHNNKYDYSLVDYKGYFLPVKIICPIHGIFKLRPNHHLQGRGCQYCSYDNKRLTTEEFIKKAKEIHGNKYDYSITKYIDSRTPISYICPIHGVVTQNPENHLFNNGCKQCIKHSLTTEEFIKKAKEVHGDKYDYSKVKYISAKQNITIICPKHGPFEQEPTNHLQGKGCPSCSCRCSSNMENELFKFISNIKNLKILTHNRSVLEGKELDIYIPEKKVAIEFDGIYWHSTKFVNKNFHLNKTLACEKKGIRLIHIFEDEWIEHSEIVKSIIASALGVYKEKIYARKCIIKDISSLEFNEFCEQNHIQGKCPSSKRFGLFYKDELVQVVGFSKPRFTKDYPYELTRMCTKLNTQVIGGFSKLMKHFGQNCISYVDRRLFNGKGYYSSNFQFIKYNKPQYFYVKGQQRFYRMNFQKKLLSAKLANFDSSLTEEENMLNNGYNKIYDCGTIVVNYT